MAKEGSLKTYKFYKQRFFAARELQFSIALMIVLGLLGGMFLQSASSALVNYWQMNAPFVGVFLVTGYALLVIVLSLSFTHRLIGPFRRLEYEMKLITSGDLEKRLTVRTQDDLHIRNFIHYANDFLTRLEKVTKDYNQLNSTIVKKIDEISAELSKEQADCAKVKKELLALEKQLKELKSRW